MAGKRTQKVIVKPNDLCRDAMVGKVKVDNIKITCRLDLGSFIRRFRMMQGEVHAVAKSKGRWDGERSNVEGFALIHSKVSEAWEACQRGNPKDNRIPAFSEAEAELADVVIRVMDLAEARGWDVAGAIVAKHEYNKTRPYKHGKRF